MSINDWLQYNSSLFRLKSLIWAECLSLPDSGHWLQPLSGLGRSRSLRSRVLPRSRSEDSGPGNTGQTLGPRQPQIFWQTGDTDPSPMRPTHSGDEVHATFIKLWSVDTLDFSLMHRSQSFQSIYPSKRRILSILSICHNTTISGNNLINLSKFEKIFSKFSLSGAGCTVQSRPLAAPWNIKIKWNKTSLCSWFKAWLTACIHQIYFWDSDKIQSSIQTFKVTTSPNF